MKTLASHETTSPHLPEHVFALISDAARWPEWSPDTEFVRRDGPLAPGTGGVMKLKGGPKLRYTIDTVHQDREYTDVTRLPGARVTFRHLVEPSEAGGSRLTAAVSVGGPLSFLWERVLGPGFRKSVPSDLQRLAEL
jgi:hypothetical protein